MFFNKHGQALPPVYRAVLITNYQYGTVEGILQIIHKVVQTVDQLRFAHLYYKTVGAQRVALCRIYYLSDGHISTIINYLVEILLVVSQSSRRNGFCYLVDKVSFRSLEKIHFLEFMRRNIAHDTLVCRA